MFIACTHRSFDIDVGETLRIYGIVNALAAAGAPVVLISNAKSYEAFHPAVVHIPIGYTGLQKRTMQALSGLVPARWVVRLFPGFFAALKAALQQTDAAAQPVYFFDYFDNTIGYLLQQAGWINGYINDVHGIATLEFDNNRKRASHPFRKLWYRVKERIADRLDRRVFKAGTGFLFGSHGMETFFRNRYRITGESLVLPYLMDEKVFLNQPDGATVATLKNQYGFTETHFVYLFVGTFKATAGVEDLLRAFDRVYKADPRCRLLLIGNGLMHRQAQTLAGTLKSRSGIVFQEPVPYHRLPDYYALAQVIVCPDSDNAFSHYVVHIKYLDALASGRLVINGAFRSVQELNPEQPLSLLFQPSDTESLYQVMEDAKEQYEQRSQQFGFASTYVRSHLTYTASVPALLAFHQRVSRHPARHASLKSIRS